jgi:hypothetical protein
MLLGLTSDPYGQLPMLRPNRSANASGLGMARFIARSEARDVDAQDVRSTMAGRNRWARDGLVVPGWPGNWTPAMAH